MTKDKLPAGKSCNDCVHIDRCYFLVGVAPTDTRCDFDPSRFQQIPTPPLACPECYGTGELAGDYFSEDEMGTCPRCGGSGDR